jgi:murein L,D-transpeptidase YcbB/YkuD
LKEDGKIGPETLKYLNRPVEDVIRRIELNMDRLRWLPDDIGERYVLVNIADYSLELVDDEEPLLGMRIVIGKVENRSYILSDKISYLELNPYWNIPESIAQKETLPLIKKNPEYLNRKRIQVIKGWSNSPVVVPPDKINWSTVDVRKFRYRLRQEPGRGNPLGRVKFMFPNKYDVYLHDTSEKRLFARTKRNFSHGCIRIEKPLDLAVHLLESDPGWTEKKLIREIRKEKNMAVKLPEAVPIHIVYWTSWVDHDGVLQFRDDIYGLDKLWNN